jgi:hypothetical protein
MIAPLTQVVPAATACQTTLPLLQRPNWVVPLHMIAPLVVQADPPATGAGLAGAPVGTGAATGAEGAGVATGAEGAGVSSGSHVRSVSSGAGAEGAEATGAILGTEGAEATGAILGTEGAEATGAMLGTEGAEATGATLGTEGAEATGASLGEAGVDGVVPVAPQSPVGRTAGLSPPLTRFAPGLGNLMGEFSTRLQVVEAMLAMSMSGSASNPVVSLAPPVTSIGAQFMYISGPPLISENQVQAKVAFPVGMLSGRV